MGFYSPKHMEQRSAEMMAFHRPTDRCFLCSEHLTGDVWVYWNGGDENNQQIWMHPDCAKRLSDYLAKDYATYQRDRQRQTDS